MIKDMSQLATTSNTISIESVNDTFNQLINSTIITPPPNVYQSSINNADANDKKDVFVFIVLCIKGLIFGTIIIGAVLGNALVIISVHKNRKLRYVKKPI